MKLLQINSTLNWGSTGRIAEEIGQVVLNKGWESYIAYGRQCNKSKSQSFRIGDDWAVYNHGLQTRLLDNHGLASRKETKHFIKQIETISPDVIHLHNIHGYYLNYSLLFDFLSQVNIPVVWTLHDCWAFTGHCSHYSYVGCNRWHTLCYDCPQKGDYPASCLIDRSEQNFRDKLHAFTLVENMTLVPVSEWLAGEVRQSFLKDYPMQVIHNGVDTEIFRPQQVCKADLGFDNRFMILGVSSVWLSRKGLKDFLKLRERLSKDEYVIVLVGLDESQIKHLPEGIIGIRRTNSVQELAKYYSIANIYFNASVEETFGLTIAESLSCGTPAIVYNSTACPEIISSDTGFIVEQGDINAVVNVVKLMKKQGKQQWISDCRERAVSLYDKRERYEEYLRLYERLISSPLIANT